MHTLDADDSSASLHLAGREVLVPGVTVKSLKPVMEVTASPCLVEYLQNAVDVGLPPAGRISEANQLQPVDLTALENIASLVGENEVL